MKRTITILIAFLFIAGVSICAKSSKPLLKTVVYCTDIHCENCAKKIRENVSFEKGVKDLSVDVSTKQVTISFDSAKTDTLALRKSINKLGYKAGVVSFE